MWVWARFMGMACLVYAASVQSDFGPLPEGWVWAQFADDAPFRPMRFICHFTKGEA